MSVKYLQNLLAMMFESDTDSRHETQRHVVKLLSPAHLAVSSSPRPCPWIDVFTLPEKSNMALTKTGDPDPRRS